ncbi:MAG TPA: STY0301 family protein [Acetobacteraceae bacterium]|nr:STY0301 family protein [Acetobacteraceae bacterium]
MLLLSLATVPSVARGTQIRCPDAQQGSPLATVTLFDGPPSEHADLEPDNFHKTRQGTWSEWDVAYIFKAGRQLYVQCQYAQHAASVMLEPGPGTYQCEYVTEAGGKVSLTCKSR